jgi:hypothetical protein
MSKKSTGCCIGPDPNWQIQDDMRTLARAEEIKRDKARHAKAKAAAREELANLKKVTDATAAVADGK